MKQHNGLEINVYWALNIFKVNYILYVDFVIVSKNSAVTTLTFNKPHKQTTVLICLPVCVAHNISPYLPIYCSQQVVC